MVQKLPELGPEWFAAIVESSDDAIIGETLDGTITYWNAGAALLFGYTAEEAVGQPAAMLVPEALVDEERTLLERAKRGQRTDHFDTQRQHQDGTPIDVSLNRSPIKDTAGKVIGVSSILRDITDRKRAEEEFRGYTEAMESANQTLEGFNSAAEAASRAKSEFLANMSHEIRTPMTAILGFSEILLGDESLHQAAPESIEALRTIQRNGKYLLDLIDDILDLSKIEAGKFEVERIACSPVELVDEVISLMKVRSAAKNLPLEVEYDGAIPEVIQCDPTRLRQILVNLVGNAIKFTEVGSVRLVVRSTQRSDNTRQLQFDVIDTGIGLTREQIERLFRPFTQADSSTTRKFGGTGLGLTISKRLAEVLGGDIRVKSEYGKGSTFSAIVEVGSLDGVSMLEHPAQAIERKKQEPQKASPPQPQLDCRILLAEDGPDNQRLISFVLKKAGADVTIVENGLLACERALEAKADGMPFDVILMDMQMPIMDGYQATRQLRHAGYTQPILALTAHAMAGDEEKCRDAGCDDYLTKPIDRSKFLPLIAHHAGKPTGSDRTPAAKILIVDGSIEVRSTLAEALEDDGYDVSLSANGENALRQIDESHVDVVLLDVDTPEMDGIDVLLALKAQEKTRNISIIMMTPSGREDKVVAALELGATDFIPKPVSIPIVRARIRNVIRLRHGHKKVAAATQAKAEFLANMSREIRTPMSAILGFVDLLHSEGDLSKAPKNRVNAIQTIKRNGEYLLDLVNDILDLSRVEAGNLDVEPTRCSVIQIVADVAALMRVKADAKRLPLKVIFEGAIPATIHTDPTRLRQILTNLLSNAVQFTTTGSVHVVVRSVRNTQDEPLLQIEVIDTGCGMTDRQMAMLYKPFSKNETYTARKYGGTGLGLTISKQVAALLGGEISVRSEVDRGTTFTVTVAAGSLEGVELLHDLNETQIEAERTDPQPIPTDERLDDCRVLLAEDGLDNQRLIAYILQKQGAKVTTADNGQIAIDLALAATSSDEPFDVILMDMEMPVMDGYYATQKLRGEGYQGAIVALTAHANSDDRKKCLAAGCDDYATKPINRRDLLRLVRQRYRGKSDRSHAPLEV
ncbi:MAG: response regulator [Planctomycetes bacterium]|nr:response regulator [Planctomycetota bacterium]